MSAEGPAVPRTMRDTAASEAFLRITSYGCPQAMTASTGTSPPRSSRSSATSSASRSRRSFMRRSRIACAVTPASIASSSRSGAWMTCTTITPASPSRARERASWSARRDGREKSDPTRIVFRTFERLTAACPSVVMRPSPWFTSSADLHVDGAGFRLLRLREPDLEEPVLELRPDLRRVGVVGQREGPGERAVRPLDPPALLVLLLLHHGALPGEGEDVVHDIDADVLLLHLRQLRLDEVLLLVLDDVDERRPLRHRQRLLLSEVLRARERAEVARQAAVGRLEIAERIPRRHERVPARQHVHGAPPFAGGVP